MDARRILEILAADPSDNLQDAIAAIEGAIDDPAEFRNMTLDQLLTLLGQLTIRDLVEIAGRR